MVTHPNSSGVKIIDEFSTHRNQPASGGKVVDGRVGSIPDGSSSGELSTGTESVHQCVKHMLRLSEPRDALIEVAQDHGRRPRVELSKK